MREGLYGDKNYNLGAVKSRTILRLGVSRPLW
jgi:hypothetical protein